MQYFIYAPRFGQFSVLDFSENRDTFWFWKKFTFFSNLKSMAVFILENALSVWTNLCKLLLFVRLCVSSIKTSRRCIIRLNEVPFEMRLKWCINQDSSCRRIMRPVPVFILETYNQTTYKIFLKFVQMDNAFSSIKAAIDDGHRNPCAMNKLPFVC